ncbi:hypothetical protein [Cohnella sp. GCM10027633]|uniref:hypothetical protein n=1 Tax=unclassified Cohnella TaxID=2636738 RepID=UPI00363F65AD
MAGIVSVLPAAGKPGGGTTQPQFIYPTQNIFVAPQPEGNSPGNIIAPIVPSELLSFAGQEVVQAFLRSMAEIQQENLQLMQVYLGGMKPFQTELERIQQNIENIVATIANQARQTGKIDQATLDRFLEEANKKLDQKIDLSKGELKLTEEERKLQEAQLKLEQSAKELAEKQKQLELEKRNKELEEKLKQKKSEKKKANDEKLGKKKKKAFDEYEAQLSQLEKERLKKDKSARDAESGTASPNTPASQSSGQPYVSPLKSLKIEYAGVPTEPLESCYSCSPVPSIEIEIPLTASEYSHSIDRPVGMISLEIERLNSEEFDGDDLKVQVNGEPVTVYFGESYDEQDVIDHATVYLERDNNVITIDVKPHGELATAGNTKRFTIHVSRPSIPAGLTFTTSTTPGIPLDWVSDGTYSFRADTAEAVESLTFAMFNGGTPISTATLTCISYENCEGTVRDGLTISGLSEGNVYIFDVEVPGFGYLTYMLVNDVPEPDWEQLFLNEIEFQLDDRYGPYIQFSEHNGEYYAEVGYDEEQLYMSSRDENEDGTYPMLGGVWDERNWTWVNGGWRTGCYESDYCDQFEPGDNHFTLYVQDQDNLYTHAYPLTIHLNDPPLLFEYIYGSNNGELDLRYAGDNTWVLYAPISENEITFIPENSWLSMSGSGENGIQLVEEELEESSVTKATYLASDSLNLLNISVSNTNQPNVMYSPYKMIIYNGLQIESSDFAIEGLFYDQVVPLLARQPEATIDPSDENLLSEDKILIGIFDHLGNRILPGSDGLYRLSVEQYPYCYIVVKDELTGIYMPTLLMLFSV